MARETVASLSKRVWALEQEKEVRACMHRYMALCDVLDAGFDLSLLMDLFSEDAVWQGVGKRYANTFGAYESKDAIAKMFEKYTLPPAHFILNSHYLTNEAITIKTNDINENSTNENSMSETVAEGQWLLLQTATFHTGKSQLSSAKLTVRFVLQGDVWLIEHFQTESLFNRPVEMPWDVDKELPTPNKCKTKSSSSEKVKKAKSTDKTRKKTKNIKKDK